MEKPDKKRRQPHQSTMFLELMKSQLVDETGHVNPSIRRAKRNRRPITKTKREAMAKEKAKQ